MIVQPGQSAPAAAAPGTSAPAPEVQPAGPAPTLENPRSQTREQLNAALTAAEQQAAQPGAPASGPAASTAPAPQGQQPFDVQAVLAEMKADQIKFQRNLQKELGQARKLQGDFAKLPDLVKQQIEAREKAARERQMRESMTAEERLALMDREAEEAQGKKSIEELVQQEVDRRWQAQAAEQEGVKNYERALATMAGDRMGELEPHIMNILGQVNEALNSEDPEQVAEGLKFYDYYSQNLGALLWHADNAFRKAGPAAGAAPAPATAPQAAQPMAAPAPAVAPAQAFRESRRQAGADASPQARSSAPQSRPATLNDLNPAAIPNMDKAQLDKLLSEAEAAKR